MPPDSQRNDARSGWSVDEPVPTVFLTLWPDENEPTRTEIEALLGQSVEGGIVVEEEIEPEPAEDDEDAAEWCVVIRIGGRRLRAVIWLTRTVEDQAGIDPDESASAEEQAGRSVFAGIKWVLCLETPLDAGDPLEDYALLMRMLSRAFPESPAIIDTATENVFSRLALDHLFVKSDLPPPVTVLWVIHAVVRDESNEEDPVWLHTHGLWRCGLPELELLEVPASLDDAAAHLINAVGELMFENDLPLPGEAFSIGPELDIAVQPWQEAAKYVAEGVPGGLSDRVGEEGEEDPEHGGVRAVIVAPEPRGRLRAVWMCPLDVLRRLSEDDTILFRSSRMTRRQAMLAQSTWPDFAMAFASLHSAGMKLGRDGAAMFVIKAAFAQDNSPGDDVDSVEAGETGEDLSDVEPLREHLWFEVSRFHGDSVDAVLVHQPVMISHLTPGATLHIPREQVSHWIVIVGDRTIEPDDAAVLPMLVSELRDAHAAGAEE